MNALSIAIVAGIFLLSGTVWTFIIIVSEDKDD